MNILNKCNPTKINIPMVKRAGTGNKPITKLKAIPMLALATPKAVKRV